MAESAKMLYIKPLKIFSHRDTIYLYARLARKPTQAYREPDYDPLLAIHRIQEVEARERLYEYPMDYDFEEVFNRNFGIIKEKALQVEVEFSGFAARYAAERMWSPDQKVKQRESHLTLTFTASSAAEAISWVLSFGEEAKVNKPRWLVKEVIEKVRGMLGTYGISQLKQ